MAAVAASSWQVEDGTLPPVFIAVPSAYPECSPDVWQDEALAGLLRKQPCSRWVGLRSRKFCAIMYCDVLRCALLCCVALASCFMPSFSFRHGGVHACLIPMQCRARAILPAVSFAQPRGKCEAHRGT